MRILSEEQVRSLTDDALAADAIEGAFRQFGLSPDVQSRPPVMSIFGPRPALGKAQFGQFTIKGASAPQNGAAGVLLYNRAYPYVFLWDMATDKPIGLLSWYQVALTRVGMMALVAARQLAPPAVGKIALFGGGRFATEAGRLLAEQWPDAELVVVTSSLASATAFAKTLPHGAVPSDDHEAAVRGADVIVTMTSAYAPFIHAGWLKPGALLLSMGGVHEVDVAVLRECDALIVDDLAYALNQGDLGAWDKSGDLPRDELHQRLRGTIGDVVADLIEGRERPDEKLFVILQGLTACDVALAKAVLDRAAEQGIGQVVEL